MPTHPVKSCSHIPENSLQMPKSSRASRIQSEPAETVTDMHFCDCRNGSEAKSTGCSSRRPDVYFQRLHSSSQPSVTRVPGDPMSSSDLLWDQTHTWWTYMHWAECSCTYNNEIRKSFLKTNMHFHIKYKQNRCFLSLPKTIKNCSLILPGNMLKLETEVGVELKIYRKQLHRKEGMSESRSKMY